MGTGTDVAHRLSSSTFVPSHGSSPERPAGVTTAAEDHSFDRRLRATARRRPLAAVQRFFQLMPIDIPVMAEA